MFAVNRNLNDLRTNPDTTPSIIIRHTLIIGTAILRLRFLAGLIPLVVWIRVGAGSVVLLWVLLIGSKLVLPDSLVLLAKLEVWGRLLGALSSRCRPSSIASATGRHIFHFLEHEIGTVVVVATVHVILTRLLPSLLRLIEMSEIVVHVGG